MQRTHFSDPLYTLEFIKFEFEMRPLFLNKFLFLVLLVSSGILSKPSPAAQACTRGAGRVCKLSSLRGCLRARARKRALPRARARASVCVARAITCKDILRSAAPSQTAEPEYLPVPRRIF